MSVPAPSLNALLSAIRDSIGGDALPVSTLLSMIVSYAMPYESIRTRIEVDEGGDPAWRIRGLCAYDEKSILVVRTYSFAKLSIAGQSALTSHRIARFCLSSAALMTCHWC